MTPAAMTAPYAAPAISTDVLVPCCQPATARLGRLRCSDMALIPGAKHREWHHVVFQWQPAFANDKR